VVNLGLWFDLRGAPGGTGPTARRYGFTLEMAEEADRLGAHSVWVSEHHLFDDGYLPQPLVFAAAIAARTTRVRVGTAVTIAPIRPAALLAEEAAVVDLLSDGRLELGVGAGYRAPEFGLYGAPLTGRILRTDAIVAEVRRLWQAGGITPRPANPDPAIWLGYQGPKGARRAGLLGESLLSADPAQATPYLEGLRDGGHDVSRARMAGGLNLWVSEDPERDWPVVREYLAAQWNSYLRHAAEGTGQPPPQPISPDRWRERGLSPRPGSFLIATPEDAAAELKRYLDGTPVETVFVWATLGGMPDELVATHARLLTTGLAPLLAA
jgi:alkanesulfonate monooxygenase SsuD/methylene tetrahydromethanopterin reductase-like flavin-dependent oxidoreductase (luciferase family)